MTLLQDRCTDIPNDMRKIYAMFQLDETGDIDAAIGTRDPFRCSVDGKGHVRKTPSPLPFAVGKPTVLRHRN